MSDINNVVLIGRLTRDAELAHAKSGTAISKFSIAVSDRKKDAHFFNITVWGKIAEALNQYLLKGKQVAINGELRQNRWEQDGQQRSRVEITANNIQLLGGKPESTGDRPVQDTPKKEVDMDAIPF